MSESVKEAHTEVKTWALYLTLGLVVVQMVVIFGQALWDLGGLDQWRQGVDNSRDEIPSSVSNRLVAIETTVGGMNDAIERVENAVTDLTRVLIWRADPLGPDRWGERPPLRPEMRPNVTPGHYIEDAPHVPGG